jgi:hypothetical protein
MDLRHRVVMGSPHFSPAGNHGLEPMNQTKRALLQKQLAARGFDARGTSPNHTIVLSDSYLEATDLADLLDVMVVRRERAFAPIHEPGGPEAAKRTYDDAVAAIEAAKTAFRALTPNDSDGRAPRLQSAELAASERAIKIATEEIDVRKVLGDY